MELIHVDLSAADLVAGSRPVLVTHGASGLADVLVEGQAVVVSDRDGEFHGAVVSSVDTAGDEPAYALHLGTRLPADMAAQRLSDADTLPEHRGLHEIVDLLGDLRRAQVTRQP